jgi:O-methyltransferase
MRRALKLLWRTAIPQQIRERLYRERQAIAWARKAVRAGIPLIPEPTYADDGLVTQHIADFTRDLRFQAAYKAARSGVPWHHPGEIQYRAYVACWAAQYALKIPGDFAECGVAQGIYSKTICEYLDFQSVSKRFFLFDTFKGIPERDLTDQNEKDLAKWFNTSHYADDLLPLVRERFAPYPNVVIVPGILPDTIAGAGIDKLSYLSIDMNNAPAEIGSITALWDKLSPGAVVLLDDYAYGESFRNQKNAWDAFARSKGFPILALPTGQGLFFKT